MEDARLIRAEVERCSRILQQMSAQSAEPMGEAPVPLDPMEFLNTVRAGFPEAMRDRIEIAVGGSERRISLPPAAARQTLTAMVKNALDASLAEQSVRLAAECDPHATRFTITDAGCGMTPETLNRIAEPFFTTKPPGRGMGLGAFLARTFAERLGGSLAFESEPGKGTRAVLELPLLCHDDQRETSGAHRR